MQRIVDVPMAQFMEEIVDLIQLMPQERKAYAKKSRSWTCSFLRSCKSSWNLFKSFHTSVIRSKSNAQSFWRDRWKWRNG